MIPLKGALAGFRAALCGAEVFTRSQDALEDCVIVRVWPVPCQMYPRFYCLRCRWIFIMHGGRGG